MFKTIKPNWFASVMGTGIVANAAVLLPLHDGLLTAVSIVFWLAAAALLLALITIGAGHFIWHPDVARSHHHMLTVAPFYGAVSMALLTVGSGALLAGTHVIGAGAALRVDAALWTLGTLTGLWCAIGIPYLLFTEHRPKLADAYGSWLMPVVPPMVSAAAGAGLVGHLAAGQARLDLLLGCYAMFGISLVMALIVITILWARLALRGVGEARMVPTLWIVLGPIGQSITATGLLAHAARATVDPQLAAALHDFALIYGVPMWGFAMAWLAIALTVTARTAREHLPFSPTWWSFTFPLGTVVTGTSELAVVGGVDVLKYVAVALFVGLVAAWTTVASRTVRQELRRGGRRLTVVADQPRQVA
jgi:C4-dicarboxylate transporter/malic acid transport protein